MTELIKRTEVYCMRPRDFEMSGCPTCDNLDPEWSEYRKHLWCPICEKDFIPAVDGIFGGPVLVNLCELLGIYFDTIDFETGEIRPGPNGVIHYTLPTLPFERESHEKATDSLCTALLP